MPGCQAQFVLTSALLYVCDIDYREHRVLRYSVTVVLCSVCMWAVAGQRSATLGRLVGPESLVRRSIPAYKHSSWQAGGFQALSFMEYSATRCPICLMGCNSKYSRVVWQSSLLWSVFSRSTPMVDIITVNCSGDLHAYKYYNALLQGTVTVQ